MAANRLSGTSDAFYQAAKAVRVIGIVDNETINAITAMQLEVKRKHPRTIVDGRVSPSKAAYGYGGGGGSSIVTLNESIQHRNVDVWPRIDKINGCPPELKQMVVRTVQGFRTIPKELRAVSAFSFIDRHQRGRKLFSDRNRNTVNEKTRSFRNSPHTRVPGERSTVNC